MVLKLGVTTLLRVTKTFKLRIKRVYLIKEAQNTVYFYIYSFFLNVWGRQQKKLKNPFCTVKPHVLSCLHLKMIIMIRFNVVHRASKLK